MIYKRQIHYGRGRATIILRSKSAVYNVLMIWNGRDGSVDRGTTVILPSTHQVSEKDNRKRSEIVAASDLNDSEDAVDRTDPLGLAVTTSPTNLS